MAYCKPLPDVADNGVIIVEDLGFIKLKPEAKTKKRVAIVQCTQCEDTRRIAISTVIHSGGGKLCPKCLNKGSNNGAYKHGGTGERAHEIWRGMIARCTKPESRAYKWYGAKGIKVCVDWEDYRSFSLWAKDRLEEPDSSIDRKDANKGYSPDNVIIIPRNLQSYTRGNSIGIVRAVKMAQALNEADGDFMYYVSNFNVDENTAKRFIINKDKHEALLSIEVD